MTTGTDDDDRCRTPQTERDRADVTFRADGDDEAERDDEDGYGFGV